MSDGARQGKKAVSDSIQNWWFTVRPVKATQMPQHQEDSWSFDVLHFTSGIRSVLCVWCSVSNLICCVGVAGKWILWSGTLPLSAWGNVYLLDLRYATPTPPDALFFLPRPKDVTITLWWMVCIFQTLKAYYNCIHKWLVSLRGVLPAAKCGGWMERAQAHRTLPWMSMINWPWDSYSTLCIC